VFSGIKANHYPATIFWPLIDASQNWQRVAHCRFTLWMCRAPWIYRQRYWLLFSVHTIKLGSLRPGEPDDSASSLAVSKVVMVLEQWYFHKA